MLFLSNQTTLRKRHTKHSQLWKLRLTQMALSEVMIGSSGLMIYSQLGKTIIDLGCRHHSMLTEASVYDEQKSNRGIVER